MAKVCHFEKLPLDVIYEILGYLSVVDIVRCRQVCRKLCQASDQRSVWVRAYEDSNTLLRRDTVSSLRSNELESSLVRATKIYWNWTLPKPMQFSRRQFPRKLPNYDFEANVISGRYLLLADRHGLLWYDLDAEDISNVILSYPCDTVIPSASFLKHQSNANGEGLQSVWVTFTCHSPTRIVVLKLNLAETPCTVTLHAEIPGENVNESTLDHDWLLLMKEFSSVDQPLDLIHVPTSSRFHVPMPDRVQVPSDLNDVKVIITAQYLFLMHSVQPVTHVETYALPQNVYNIATPSPKRLAKSHWCIFPHVISSIKVTEVSRTAVPGSFRVSFLALVYLKSSPTSWTSKIGLHVFDADLEDDVASEVTVWPRCHRTLDVGIANTSLALTAGGEHCLAVTHSSPGPVILAHHIHRPSSSECVMNVKKLNVPEGMLSRSVLDFDGIRGRLCLVAGYTHIEVLDYA